MLLTILPYGLRGFACGGEDGSSARLCGKSAASDARRSNSADVASGACWSDEGVTILEFALIIPVMILFILAFIDLVRVIAVQGVLVYVAEQTLQVAATMPNFDVDIRTADPSSAEYQRFLLARQRILQDAAKLPTQTLLTDSATYSSAQLIRFSYQDPAPVGQPVPAPFSADVAILRPGERVKVGDPTSSTYFNHETYPFPGAGVSDPSQERLLRTQPIIVELRAQVKTFTPILGSITTKGVAQGFRDQVPRGPMPDEVLSPGTTVTAWPSPTPAATPLPFPEPTAMPTPGGCNVNAAVITSNKTLYGKLPDTSKPSGFNCSVPFSTSILGP